MALIRLHYSKMKIIYDISRPKSILNESILQRCLSFNDNHKLVKNFVYDHKKGDTIIRNKYLINLFKIGLRKMASANSNEEHKKILRLEERLVWIDLEMTGLDVDKEKIMEAAVIVTDSHLNTIAEGPNIIIHVDEETLNNMGQWCKTHHGESGLTSACLKSNISLTMAEDKILQFVAQHTEPGKSPLAGNSIHADKRFLDKYMPKLMKHLHYRIVDVSTIKELCRRWYPEEYSGAPTKKGAHRALDDIKESIGELRYYKNAIFK